MGLIYSYIARADKNKIVPHHVNDDFVSDLFLSLCVSATKFDASKGFKFSTFAFHGFNFCLGNMARKYESYKNNNFSDQNIFGLAEENKSSYNEVENNLLLKTMNDANLTGREKSVIYFYYFDQLSMGDIGKEFGLSRERIAQIKNKAINKIRECVNRNRLSMMDFYKI